VHSASASAAPRTSPQVEPEASAPPWPSRFWQSLRGFAAPSGEVLKGSAKSIVCEDRTLCRVLSEQAAGRDVAGRALSVVAISLHAHSRAENLPPPGPDECEPIEYWLVARSKAGVVEVDKLLELCNDGYGASGVGEDIVEVKPNRFSHTQSGGSSWRFSETQVRELSPRRVVSLETSGFWTIGPNRRQLSWNWETFSGSAQNYAPECAEGGPGPQHGEAEETRSSWIPIPVVDVEADYAASGWKQAELGACAAQVGADGTGFVAHGEHGGAADSHFKVVGLADGSFVLQVHDDHFVLSAKQKLHEDHLEVWAGNAPPRDFMAHCEEKLAEKPVQWGVRLADGAVFSGYGAPAVGRLQVEMASRDGAARLKIRLLDAASFVSFVYSDSDDGLRQKALIASSNLLFGNLRSLGETLRIHPEDAVCALSKQRLEPLLK
jgi:hypothetical protein